MEEALIKRVMPHSVEAEQSVVGAMLMDRDAITTSSEIISGNDFYQSAYGVIFDSMVELYNEGKPVDLITLQERLREKELSVDLYVLGSTQEETHSSGAITAAYEIAPNLCVAVDVTHGDSPDASKNETFKLGGGPVIGVGPNCTRSLSGRLKELAAELDMPVQIEVMPGSSGTNAWPIQVSREGVATAVVSIPERYMHTPVEVVNQTDLENTAALLAAFVESLGEGGTTC